MVKVNAPQTSITHLKYLMMKFMVVFFSWYAVSLESYHIPDHIFYAVFPERQYLPAKVRAFLDFTVEYFGGDLPYWDI